MSQNDLVIANQSFPSFRTDLNSALQAINTSHSGTSRPSGAVAGTIWLDTTGTPTANTLKFFDGTDDISLATINYTANTVDWLDSSVTITGLSTTATGTVLTLTDSAHTTTVNMICGNNTALRFNELTANGSNYIGLKAPASLSADLTFTLPSTDGTNGQALVTNGSGVLSFTTISAGTSWQSVQTTGFTAVNGRGYPCNTTSSAFTVTLPASPSVGDYIQIVDYAGTFATNNITLGANSNKINGVVENKVFSTNREAVTITYVDSTQGWVSTSASNYGSQSLDPAPYTVDFLVIAGGGGGGGYLGGGGAGGYRNSYSTETSGGGGSSEASLSFIVGTTYTVTVGAGGAFSSSPSTRGTNGVNSSISGTGITTITSSGGGGGGASTPDFTGGAGGSGGGGGNGSYAGGSGTANQGYAGSASYSDGLTYSSGGGGGGAGSAGVAPNFGSPAGLGGSGLASSITASSITRGGGGGGGTNEPSKTRGTGGSGGGGNGGNSATGVATSAGTANTGGGGGGGFSPQTSSSGGSGVVILRMPTANYSGTTTGSPTVTTSGSDTIIVFNSSGSITG